MSAIAKTLIPNKEWLLKRNGSKIGSLVKDKKGYNFLQKGTIVPLKNFKDLKENPDIQFENNSQVTEKQSAQSFIYDYPCSSVPFNPVYNVKNRLPLFSKSEKSKSQYCAGHYVIQFRKGWVKSFCPKLITLERYPYYGPFKTEQEMKTFLSKMG